MAIPAGWIATGQAPQDYEFALDGTEKHSGTKSALLRARAPTPSGFGTLMQQFVPDDYRGRRVRLAAWIKTVDVVAKECKLWMRIDGPAKRVLAFGQSALIKGTTSWQRYEVVLDVGSDAEVLSFGLLLDGVGSAWLDDVSLEVVGSEVPVTAHPIPQMLHHPRNLNFEE